MDRADITCGVKPMRTQTAMMKSEFRHRGQHKVAADRVALYEGVFVEKSSHSERAFEIELVRSAAQHSSALNLINRMYAWRGYGSNHRLSESENRVTFNALVEGELVGTLSLTVDSNSGLACDSTFQDVLDEVRKDGEAKACELTKFAFEPSVTSMHVLASLFHTIFIYGTEKYDCTDLFIEVNPRHVRFYEVMLGFTRMGELRTNPAVEAPSQLMRLQVADIGRFIEEFAGQTPCSKRSLYPYFLTAAQECIIQERIARLQNGLPVAA